MPGFLSDTAGRCDGLLQEPWITDGGELDQPDPIWIPIQHVCRKAKREPSLAGAARPGQRDEAGLPQQAAQFTQLPLASDERADLGGQVVWRAHPLRLR